MCISTRQTLIFTVAICCLTKNNTLFCLLGNNPIEMKSATVIGGRLTIGDFPAGAAAFRYYSLVEERPTMPNLDRWYAALGEMPAYRKHVMNPLS